MAAYFEIEEKLTGELFYGRKIIELDRKIAKAFGDEPSSERWYRDWYNWLGLGVALGNSWNEIRLAFTSASERYSAEAEAQAPDLMPVIAYLEENFVNRSYMGF